MSPREAHIRAFWQAYLDTLPSETERPSLPESFAFGDDPELADELAALVLAGKKRATASSLTFMEALGEQVPEPGLLSIILDGQGDPVCIIETTAVDIVPFAEVGAEFAYAEGEGDRSLEHWRRAHRAYFGRILAPIGLTLTDNMPVVCEQFRVIYPEADPESPAD